MHSTLQREKFSFTNNDGDTLDGLIERAHGEVKAWVLFAHCFTCSKNIGAATRISRYLAARGFGVLRFDFTGLGNSEGDFANTNFSSNIDDLLAAAEAMIESDRAPALLVGHSLGGAAVLAAAPHIDTCRAVATVGAPSEPAHVTHLFADAREALARDGVARVRLGQREFTVARQFIEDLERHALQEQLPELGRALLIMHSPSDDVVEIEHARRIYESAQHPKSFVSLENADHLLSDPRDAEYVAELLAAWASRYLQTDQTEQPARPRVEPGDVLVVEREGYTQDELHQAAGRRIAELVGVEGAHVCACATAGSTPATARTAKPGPACSTRSSARSPSRVNWDPPSASACCRLPTAARSTARCTRKSRCAAG